MKKYHAKITRDIVRRISMGPLVISTLGISGFGAQEIAPARIAEIPAKAGSVRQFSTRKDRDTFIAAINAEHPNAAEAI